MKNLFVCTTPFQLMTCIALNKNLKGDLVVLDKFNSSQELCERVRHSDVFENVTLFDDSQMWSGNSKSWIVLRLKTANSYRKCKKLIERFFPNIREYTDIFVSSRQQVNRLLCMYVAEWMPKTKIHYFDDGLGSYSQSVTKVKRFDKFLRRILVGRKAANFTYQLHLYAPEMYQAYNGTEENIQKLIVDNETRKEIASIFCVASRSLPKGILFDTIPAAEFYNEGIYIYDELVDKILRQGNIVIKQHPRNKEFKYQAEYIENVSVPFEVMCSEADYSNSVFFTSFSTAVFTPKLIYDQEPMIVFLYKILKEYRRDKNQNCDMLVECLRHMYKNPEIVLTPRNQDELTMIIKTQSLL
ncbi:MAG: polysialyltransferase family glycosyltransferase [Bacillota bacterium]|jgi:hypothetical protein